MKYRVFTWFYLLVMVSYLARPVMPFIEYALNKDYIAHHLCIYRDIPGNHCQGKCHLDKQLQKSTENNGTDQKNSRNNIRYNQVDDHLMVSNMTTRPDEKNIFLYFDTGHTAIVDYTVHVFVPPKGSR